MEIEYQSYLVGSGHFAFGFIVGFFLMQYLNQIRPENLKVQLYCPFLPVLLGIWAALPYFFYQDITAPPFWLNSFVLYSLIHNDELFIILLGRPNWVVLVCGVLYALILLRYIRLAKYVRRNGWPGDTDA